MIKKFTRNRFLILMGFIGLFVLDFFFLLDAFTKTNEKDAIIGWINYLGQPVGADAQLLISILVLILLIICLYFFIIEKQQKKKQEKLSGKQKKKAQKFDALRSQKNFRRF